MTDLHLSLDCCCSHPSTAAHCTSMDEYKMVILNYFKTWKNVDPIVFNNVEVSVFFDIFFQLVIFNFILFIN